MPLQAILLTLVILVSMMVNSGANNNASSVALSQPAAVVTTEEAAGSANNNNDIGNPFNVFTDDIFSAMSHIGKGLALAANNLENNFKLAKEVLSLKKPQAAAYSNEASSSPALFPDSTLTSKPEIEKIPQCDFGSYKFTNKEMLAKYIDGEIIFESNSENRWPIASITKLMTAVVALEKTDTNKEITMSREAVDTEGVAGDFKTGETFKEIDLIKAMLVASSNDAAAAIAKNFEGGENDFIDQMQKKAAELRMLQTTYLEPTGLSFINQSTAKDLSILMAYIYSSHPEILEISRQKEIIISELQTGKQKKIANIDKFAGQTDFVGGKTGFIDESGRNLIGVFDISGKTIVTVVLGADNSFEETAELKNLIQNCE